MKTKKTNLFRENLSNSTKETSSFTGNRKCFVDCDKNLLDYE